VEGGWKLEFILCFIETTHELLHLDKLGLVQYMIMDIPASFILIIILHDEVLKCGNSVKF
jgi:hypothetical protein